MIIGTGTIVKIEIPSRSSHVQSAVHIDIGMPLWLHIFELGTERSGKGGTLFHVNIAAPLSKPHRHTSVPRNGNTASVRGIGRRSRNRHIHAIKNQMRTLIVHAGRRRASLPVACRPHSVAFPSPRPCKIRTAKIGDLPEIRRGCSMGIRVNAGEGNQGSEKGGTQRRRKMKSHIDQRYCGQ